MRRSFKTRTSKAWALFSPPPVVGVFVFMFDILVVSAVASVVSPIPTKQTSVL